MISEKEFDIIRTGLQHDNKREKWIFLEELKKEPVTVALIIINILVFLTVDLGGDSLNTANMLQHGAAYTPFILEGGQYYRLFTSIFLHFGIQHLANNMLVLFVLGQRMERVFGGWKFLVLYLAGGLGGNLVSLYMDTVTQEYAVSAGASGAVFAVMGAMIYVVLRRKGRVEDLTVKQIVFMAVVAVLLGLTDSGVDNAAHIGGMVCGFLVSILLYHPRKIRKVEP